MLPDDERIRTLKVDPPVDKSEVTPKKEPTRLKHFVVRSSRVLYIIIFIVPVVTISLLLFLYATIKGWNAPKDQASIFDEKFEAFQDFVEKFRPFPNHDRSPSWNYQPPPDLENVPQFLSHAKKHAYRIILYSFNPDAIRDRELIHLKDEGLIHDIFFVQDEKALEELFQSEYVDQERSHIVYKKPELADGQSAEEDLILSSGAIKSGYQGSFKTFSKCGRHIMFSRIKLPFNKLLDETVVLYYETEHHPAWNRFIRENYTEIHERLSKKGLRLLFFPALISNASNTASYQELITYLYPDQRIGNVPMHLQHLQSWFSTLDVQEIYALLERQFSIPYSPVPCLIHCVELIAERHGKQKLEYSQIPLWSEDETGMRQEIDHYLEHVNFPESQVFYSLVGRNDFEYDADEEFPIDGLKVSEPLMARIRELRQLTPETKMLSTLFHFIQSFRDMDPALCKKLSAQLYDSYPALTRQMSRLYIDKQFRIFLPDFGNIEIEMTPLPKTLFLFMLKYPDGVLFKELYRHKQELIFIYGRIGNRSDPDQMLKSINDMTDARSNSVNEKSSRIKEAFLSKIDDRIAAEYYITGQRQEPKKIRLDRRLLQFEEPI